MVSVLAWAVSTVLRRVAEKGSRLYSVCVSTARPLGFGHIPKEVASTKDVEYRIGSAAAHRELRGVSDKRRLLHCKLSLVINQLLEDQFLINQLLTTDETL